MKYPLLPRIASMFGVWALLVGWSLLASGMDTVGNLVFLAIIMVPLTMSGAEAAFYRRFAFRNEYLLGNNWLARLMGLEPLVLVAEGVKALLLGLVLMVATLSLELREWAVLLLDVLALSLLMPRLPGLLHDVVKPEYLYALSRRWAIWVSTMLLWLQSLLVLVLVQSDHYRGLTWEEAIVYSTAPTASTGGDTLVAMMARFDAGVNGVASWASYRLLHGPSVDGEWFVALVLMTATLLLWFVLAWAFSRALIGVMARPLAVWRPRPQRRDSGNVFETWWL